MENAEKKKVWTKRICVKSTFFVKVYISLEIYFENQILYSIENFILCARNWRTRGTSLFLSFLFQNKNTFNEFKNM